MWVFYYKQNKQINMKGDISKWEKEIIDFFASKELDVIVVNKDIQADPNYKIKSQQCNVAIQLKEKTLERRALGISPIYRVVTLAQFQMTVMPGCCGIVISTNAWVLHTINGQGIGQWLHQLRIRMAKWWGYGILMCTDVTTNAAQKHILKKNQWKDIYNFKNPRTGNDVDISVFNLTK